MPEAWHVLLLAAVIVAGTGGQYVTEEDREIASLARNNIDLYCHGQRSPVSVDRAAGYAELEKHLGGDNIAFEVLSQAGSADEVPNIFMEKYGWGWIIRRSILVIIGVVMLSVGCLLYSFKKCRCCAIEQPTRDRHKTCVMIIVVLVLVGIAWCAVTAVLGFRLQQEGMQNSRCTLARFLDRAALGDPQGDDTFIGLFPLLQRLEELEQTLDNGTAFDEASKSKILAETDKLDRAADLANENLALLTDELNANKKLLIDAPTYHDCVFCDAILPYVNNASETMKNSIATRLGQTRAEVEKSIQNGGNQQLKQNLKKTTDAAVGWKDLVIDGSRKLFKDGLLALATKHESWIKWACFVAVLVVSLSAILLIFIACLSVYRFKYHERKEEEELEEGREPINPYNKMIHQWARRTWCWAFVYVTFTLLVAGVLNVLIAPFSSFCLVLHDLDGDTLEKISPGLNISFEGEQGTNWKGIMDKCVQQSGGDNVNTFLLDMLVTSHGGSLKEDLIQSARDTVKSRFAAVVESSARPAPPLLVNPVMQELRQALNADVPGMVVGNRESLKGDDDYADIKLDGDTNLRTPIGQNFNMGQLGVGLVVNNSVRCDNYTTPAKLGDFSEITIAGIQEFVARLEELGAGSSTIGSTCAKKVVCRPKEYWNGKVNNGYLLEQVCLAANRYMDLKARMMTEDMYRCNLFTEPGRNSACDPKDMQNHSGTWTGDCLDTEGAVTVFERACDLSDLASYMKSWDSRLEKVLQRADAEVARIRVNANLSLEQLIGLHIDDPIEVLSGGVTCSFLSDYFQEGIDGFCYQGVLGTRHIARSYFWSAIWTALLIPTMYGVYCRSKGNWENWRSDPEHREAWAIMKKKYDEESLMDSLLGKKKKEEATWIGDPNAGRISAPATAGPPPGRRKTPAEDSSSEEESE